MTIITKPSTIQKDVPATFTLDKSALAALPIVMADAWFADSANWKKVILNYGSSLGNEIITVSFDATLATPTSSFLAISPSRDVFEIISITIQDFNQGTLRVPTSSLNQAEFIVDLSIVPSLWDALSGSASTTGGGQLQRNDYTLGWDAAGWNTTPITGDFTLSGVYNLPVGMSGDMMVGYRFSLPVGGSGITNYINTSIYFHGSATVGSTYGGSPIIVNPTVGLNTAPATNTFEISRVSGVITAKVNGTTMFTENYSGTLYVAAPIFANDGQSFISATLV